MQMRRFPASVLPALLQVLLLAPVPAVLAEQKEPPREWMDPES